MAMTAEPTQPNPMSPEMQADMLRWQKKEEEKRAADARTASTFSAVREQMLAALSNLPDSVEVPYHLTPEGERWEKFKKVCDPRFHPKIDYSLVTKRAAFDRVCNWDGSSPGLCAVGETGAGKTRAAWWALRRLYVRENKAFAWFPARRLCTELQKYEDNNAADEFFRAYDFFKILFVDDAEKINWQFQSHSEMLFSFFDWVYRTKKPCIVTTNKDRKWWEDKMGEAFVRRLFDDACVEVEFK